MFLKVVKQPCPFSRDPLPSGGNCQRFSVHCGDQSFSFITTLLLCLHHPPRPQSCTQDTTGTSTTKKCGSNAGAENRVTWRWPQAAAAAVKPDHAQHVGQPLLRSLFCKVVVLWPQMMRKKDVLTGRWGRHKRLWATGRRKAASWIAAALF